MHMNVCVCVCVFYIKYILCFYVTSIPFHPIDVHINKHFTKKTMSLMKFTFQFC